MKVKTLAPLLLAAALLGVTGLCGLTALGTYRWVEAQGVQVRLFERQDVPAQATERRAFPVTGPLTLEVDTQLGDIQVAAEDGGNAASVEIVRKAWGGTEAAALAAAQALPVGVELAGDHLKLVYRGPARNPVVLLGSSRPNRVSFNIQVPAGTCVVLKTGAGDIGLSGTRGAADLQASFGEVSVTALEGPLTIGATSANLTVKEVRAGAGDIRVETSFGEIHAAGLDGRDIRLRSASGAVLVSQVTASGELAVENQFTRIQVEDLQAATLKVTNQGGEVLLQRGEIAGALEVQTSFAALEVRQVKAGSYTLATSQGSLILAGAQGRLDLTNRFGEIQVSEAAGAILNLKDENGKISFSGSLDERAGHSIATTFSDILLAIPANSALNLSLETQFGQIRSELPVTRSGQLSETNWQAELNGGGAQLKAVTSNGNISVVKYAREK